MASKIVRKTMLQFAGSLAASGNIAIFGSAAAATIGYSLDPVVIQSLAAWLGGWGAAVLGNNAPAKQDRNAIDFVFSYQLGYLLAQGMAEYDPNTPYFTNGFCAETGVIYVSLVDNNLGHDPATDVASGTGGVGNYWKTLASTVAPSFNKALLTKFWCKFAANGSAGLGLVAASIPLANITLTRNSQGTFTIQVPTGIFADANYVVTGTCWAANGGSIGNLGNNNHVIGGGLQTQTQFRIVLWEAVSSLGAEDADYCMVTCCGN